MYVCRTLFHRAILFMGFRARDINYFAFAVACRRFGMCMLVAERVLRQMVADKREQQIRYFIQLCIHSKLRRHYILVLSSSCVVVRVQ